MTRIKSIASIALSALLALSVFTGCAPAAKDSATPSTTPSTATDAKKDDAPKKDVVLKIMDSSDSTQARRKVFNEEFMTRHPEIKVEYTMMSGDQATTTLTTAIKSGTAPDLFALPNSVKLETAINEGWFQTMSPFLTAEFVNSFEAGALNEGTTTKDGQIYILPEALNIVNSLMFYNKTVLKDAGLDPENPPKTWTEFTAACKQITEKGKGKSYGIIESGLAAVRCEIELRSFASLAGAKCNYLGVMSLVDGKNTLDSAGMKSALGLYDTLAKDGSIHPNSVNLAAPEARALFAQGQAGFIIQGSWCIPTWRAENKDLDFGVMALPAPDDGIKGGNPYIGAQPWMGLSATSKNPEAAALYLTELYGEEYQGRIVSDGGFVSAIKGVNEKSMSDKTMLEYFTLAKETGKIAPDPISINPKTAAVYAEVKEVTPNLGQIFQGVLAGSIKDYSKQLDELAAATQKEWERAIGAVEGVSAADFEFKDWDPMKDYGTK